MCSHEVCVFGRRGGHRIERFVHIVVVKSVSHYRMHYFNLTGKMVSHVSEASNMLFLSICLSVNSI